MFESVERRLGFGCFWCVHSGLVDLDDLGA